MQANSPPTGTVTSASAFKIWNSRKSRPFPIHAKSNQTVGIEVNQNRAADNCRDNADNIYCGTHGAESQQIPEPSIPQALISSITPRISAKSGSRYADGIILLAANNAVAPPLISMLMTAAVTNCPTMN